MGILFFFVPSSCLPPSLKLRRTTVAFVRLRAKRYGETSPKLEERRRGEGGRVFVLHFRAGSPCYIE